jgi:hypothetical protein
MWSKAMRLKGDKQKKYHLATLAANHLDTIGAFGAFGAFMDFMAAPVFQVANQLDQFPKNQLRGHITIQVTTWHPLYIIYHHLLAINKSVCQGSPSSVFLESTHWIQSDPIRWQSLSVVTRVALSPCLLSCETRQPCEAFAATPADDRRAMLFSVLPRVPQNHPGSTRLPILKLLLNHPASKLWLMNLGSPKSFTVAS